MPRPRENRVRRALNLGDTIPPVPYNRGVADRSGCPARGQPSSLTTRGTVEKALFSIVCTTCRARLRVRSEEAVGAILECPKCGSMVQVVPPEGWQPPAPPVQQPADAGTPAAEGAVTAAAGIGPEAAAGVETGSPGPPGVGVSPAELAWRRRLLFAAVPAAGLVVVVGLYSAFFWWGRPQPPPSVAAEEPPEAALSDRPAVPEKRPQPQPPEFDRRWLPDGTTLLMSLYPSRLAGEPNWSQLPDRLDGVWGQTVGAVLPSLGLKPEGIRRLTWASTDLAAWPEQSVVLIELEQGQDAAVLGAVSEAIDLKLAGVACRRVPGAAWRHPLAVIDGRTIVTGHVELLRQLAERGEPGLQSATLERLLDVVPPDAELTLLVDLAAARRADWRLPTAILDVWPPGKQPWHVIWEMSEGLGCRLQSSDHFRSELVLVCEGETAAEKVQAAVGELLPAAEKWLSAQIDALPARLQAGQITAAAAEQYGLLLKEGLAASDAARWKVADGTVWVWVDWSRRPSVLVAAAVDSRPVIDADWLAAARKADEANHRRLLGGLDAYGEAEGQFPPAAIGGARLSPEERLSWIAAMLPYYGYGHWHGQLESGRPWNSPQNRPVTQRPLPEVVNPALGASRTEAGFPVTHYVGVAGVGPDAGRLPAGHPRAGMFGHGRHTRPEEIADGAANTIAILGASRRLGAWAAGGEPTVRALTARPYVNGPDGFGSGQPDGMLAGMADGSVRFISKDIDPSVLEQLATINDRGGATAVAVGPKPPAPKQGPDRLEPKPSGPGEGPNDTEPEDVPPELPPDEGDEQPPPAPVDVKARLADTVPEIELREVPLGEAIDTLAGLSTVPMTFDPEAMQRLGVTVHDPVTVRLSAATVGQVLDGVLSSRGLAAVVEDGQVLLTDPADQREKLWSRKYTVSDLTGEEPAAVAELAALIEKLVAPESWRRSGGRGSIKPDGGALAVVQTGVVHHQILVFCEKLRNARGKPLRSRHDPARFTLKTRLARAKQALGRPVTANFHEPTPLIKVLAYLGGLAETDILLDRLALGAAGLWDRSRASVTVEKRPLGEALDEALGPLGLRYRVIDATTLQVTTPKAIAARLELEFYPVAELLSGGRTGPALVEQIKGRLAASTWSDAGGPAVLHFDAPSNCLIVLQSQPVQGELERLLAGLRN